MIKKNLILILIFLIFNTSIYAASSSSGSSDNKTPKVSNYSKGTNLIKQAKKLEKKNKVKKAKKKFIKSLKYLTIANKEKPNNPNTLNYLGFASRKVGNLDIAEKYYLKGLALDPQHVGINEYLGELYVNTGRINKAKERLKVLENCKCKEFEELNTAIKSGTSKY